MAVHVVVRVAVRVASSLPVGHQAIGALVLAVALAPLRAELMIPKLRACLATCAPRGGAGATAHSLYVES